MKYTHLEMVQLILSSMDSDEVNSYDDTVESVQVSNLLKSVFYDCATDLGLPEHETLLELNASGSSSQPTLMTIPSNVTRLLWIKYNNQTASETKSNYIDVTFKPFETFLQDQMSLRSNSTGVGEMTFTMNGGESFEMMYWNDRMPSFFTTLDENIVLFDAYDASIDTTLQKSKTMCAGMIYPVYTIDNDFIPDLEPTQFSYFINKAKFRAFNELKQQVNQEAGQEARRQKVIVQKRQRKTPDQREVFKVPRYGRTPSMEQSSPFHIERRLKMGS